ASARVDPHEATTRDLASTSRAEGAAVSVATARSAPSAIVGARAVTPGGRSSTATATRPEGPPRATRTGSGPPSPAGRTREPGTSPRSAGGRPAAGSAGPISPTSLATSGRAAATGGLDPSPTVGAADGIGSSPEGSPVFRAETGVFGPSPANGPRSI